MLGSTLLDAAPKQEGARRLFKSFSAQGLAIIVLQVLSLGVLLTVFKQQSPEVTSGSVNLRGEPASASVTDLLQLQSKSGITELFAQTQHKFAVKHVTPVQYQYMRGTCWDFTITALIEHHYRMHGIEMGWLQPDTYVKFSQQALGATLMNWCAQGNSKFCMSPGDDLWTGNSTEGAEVELLYYVKELGGKVLPHSICPYTQNAGQDGLCLGMEAAQKTNPVKFEVRDMKTFYDRIQIKDHLRRYGHAMGLSATIVGSHFYLPCVPEFTSKPGMYQRACTGPSACEQCPADHAFHNLACCAKIERPGYNMEGEFFARDATIDGGHAMTLVGWNDIFRSTQGDVGGWIVKNSWWDGKSVNTVAFQHARGSHSMAYFMLEISDTDERAVCPNSYNPRNWYPCAGQNAVKTAGRGDEVHLESGSAGPSPSDYNLDQTVAICTNKVTKLKAQNQRRPLELTCRDAEYCNTDPSSKLFLINATYLAGGLHKTCFLESKADEKTTAFCLPPLLIDDVAMFIEPADHEVKENDKDLCGFYFFPFSLIEQTTNIIGAATYDVQGFDIKWDPSSYDRGDAVNPKGFDYGEIRRSTHKQNDYHFSGDLPNQMGRK